ncbi:MAG: multiheme c-type cytochrome [Planctomycetota bacterium]
MSDPSQPRPRIPQSKPAWTARFGILLALATPLCGCRDDSALDAQAKPGPVVDSTAPSVNPLGPRLRLRLSGGLEGRLEPCGCASGQIGGLARRSFRVQSDASRYDYLIEGGDLVEGGSTLDELKLLTILEVLADRRAPYDALALGPRDLELDPAFLGDVLSAFPKLPVLAADVRPIEGKEFTWPVRSFVDLNKDGRPRVRVVSLVMRMPERETSAAATLTKLDPAEAWSAATAGLEADRFLVLLVHGGADGARRLTALSPKPDLIVAVGDVAEPPAEPELRDGVPVVQPGIRGRFLLDVSLARGGDGTRVVAYERVTLEGSKTTKGAMEDPDVRAQVLAHRHQAKDDGARAAMANRFPLAEGLAYVGSARCATCHAAAAKAWEGSEHAHAWETLENAETSGRYPWPVTHYPDCITCHTVGYGQVSGFVDPDSTPTLRGVGCESCHGPGSRHVSNPIAQRLGRVDSQTCTKCHDFEQSPSFDYAERWKRIEHGK